jgi:hypothetical protein
MLHSERPEIGINQKEAWSAALLENTGANDQSAILCRYLIPP